MLDGWLDHEDFNGQRREIDEVTDGYEPTAVVVEFRFDGERVGVSKALKGSGHGVFREAGPFRQSPNGGPTHCLTRRSRCRAEEELFEDNPSVGADSPSERGAASVDQQAHRPTVRGGHCQLALGSR